MPKVLSLETRPFYAQIALFDPSVPEAYPDWGDGQAEAVFGAHGIVVETRPDHLGPVAIEVWTGELHGAENLRLVASDKLAVEGNHGVLVGSVTGNDLHKAEIPAGNHWVDIYAIRTRGEVDGLYFVFRG
jgi:hypothetical protein